MYLDAAPQLLCLTRPEPRCPARGVHCVARLRNEVRSLGIEIRARVRTGEIGRRLHEKRGIQALKGIPGTWRLFAVTEAD